MSKEYEPAQLRRIQLIQLEMLLEVKRICEKHQIQYCVIAGTMLGAVRHGGYIPWDDDADVAFMRPQYEQFRQACETDLDTERFYFQDHRNTPGYRWGYGKLRRKHTRFIREGQEHMPYPSGIFIDIFPLDYTPESYAGRFLYNLRCYAVRKILWSEIGKTADQSPIARFIYRRLSRIPLERAFSRYERLVEKSRRNPSSWVRILTFPTPNHHNAYRARWYTVQTHCRFEGHEFSGVGDYGEYLAFKFGDYMTLPPPHKRKNHPASVIEIDFDVPSK